ncbi:MAG: hypothetical protein ACYS74_09490, partial [Planctomycetota bacterium]
VFCRFFLSFPPTLCYFARLEGAAETTISNVSGVRDDHVGRAKLLSSISTSEKKFLPGNK